MTLNTFSPNDRVYDDLYTEQKYFGLYFRFICVLKNCTFLSLKAYLFREWKQSRAV
jgi:hypothetical protein